MSFVFLDDQVSGRQKVFRDPLNIITAQTRADLPSAFAAIDAAQADGKWLAGTLNYELGHALESHFEAPAPSPLIELGVFDAPDDHPPVDWLYTRDVPELNFVPAWSEADYLVQYERVQNYLRAGDCYQVNLTFPMTARCGLSPTHLYAAFRRRQPGRYGAVVALGEASHVSFSPELFFERRGRDMRMRPMKGTRPRAGSLGQSDASIIADMQAEPKSRAENLMIVDLLRNDLSRLCEAGSVRVPELFALETYPTLHQMTSQVTGRLRDGVAWQDILRSLFPCGSVTGAPKIRAMEIISELEEGPRGIYCGAVGYIAPNGDTGFSVAIRTATLENGTIAYPVGSGVVLDSDGSDEYRECLLKAKIFETRPEGIIETVRRPPHKPVMRAAFHADRMHRSLGTSQEDLSHHFESLKTLRPDEDLRIRLTTVNGRTRVEAEDFKPLTGPVHLALSRYALKPDVQETAVKTTARDFYDGERARISALTGATEVIFLNAKNEVCEGSFTSLFIERGGQLLTPTLSAGLLPGVLRAALIADGTALEATLTPEDLMAADAVLIGNSLRGLMTATFIDYLRH